ncbi:MAG: hypothetical protein Ta2B_10620 [Termitinemataceae bacterium]|nr:MAG: hypothetical protein Ta2B_10620 [Termitinemataceae bacterium]
MQCTSPINLWDTLGKKLIKYPNVPQFVPCGKCMNCRISRTREWSMRLQHELSTTPNFKAVFLTLTYDDDHLPSYGSLVKADLQKFFKRLRKNLASSRYGEEASKPPNGGALGKLKYYACGEYGSQTFRPHYHAIIFGLGLDPLSKQIITDSWSLCDWTFERIQASFGTVTPDSCSYVTKYIQKKLSGDLADIEYENRQAPFQVASNGLGRTFVDLHRNDLVKRLSVRYNGQDVGLPRYYRKLLGIEADTIADLAIKTARISTNKLLCKIYGKKYLYKVDTSEVKFWLDSNNNLRNKTQIARSNLYKDKI